MKDYELIEHTADLGVRVSGSDLKQVFVNVAKAMFDIIAEPCKACNSLKLNKFEIRIEGEDQHELFIGWLNELLSLSEAKETIFEQFQINKLTQKQLEAVACGYPRENYRIKTEMKAATYHQLKIQEIDSHWQAEVIFDV